MPFESGAYGRGWSRLRRQVLERDGYVCRFCGVELRRSPKGPGAPATVDHLVPVAELLAVGERVDPASVHPDDLAACCDSCNVKRGQATRAKVGRARKGNAQTAPSFSGFARPSSPSSPWGTLASVDSARAPDFATLESLRGES